MPERELPEGWEEAPIGVFCMDIEQRVPGENEKFFYIDIGSVDRNTKAITGPTELLGIDAPSRARKCVLEGDVLVSMTRPNLNAVALVPPELDGHIASTGFDVLRCPDLDCHWLFFLVRTKEFVESMSNLVQGALYPAVKTKDIRSFVIPVAPINEQRRITASLETALAAVDACRQRLDGVAAILKRFRQAVLAAATSGELTREWREEMEISEVWDDTELSDLVSDIRYGTAQKCSYEKVGNPVLRIPNIIEGQISHEDLKYASFEPPEIDKLSIRNGDLLVIRSNGSLDLVGRTALASEVDEGFLFAGYLIRLRPRWEKVVPRFLLLVLSSPDTRRRVELAARSTSGVNNINSKFLSGLPLFLPSLEEQQEICRRAQDLFTLADQLEGRLNTARKDVDRLTPALLAKAFRGELVPQDPNDEPASLLLERIRAASNAVPAGSAPSQRGRRKPLAHTELSSPAPAPVPTNDPSRVFLVRTGDETTQGEKALSRVSKSKPPDILKGWSPMQKDLIQILEQHLAWISASTACEEMGISDGSSSDDLELFYRQLKEQVEGGVVDVQRRGDEDWLRLSNRAAA
jgi:type I restriction enzyme S subunit